MDIVNLMVLVILIALTAFFVAAEFAVVKVRTTKIDQLIQNGNKTAISAKTVITHLDEYLSACQLGITVTALGIGWLGEPSVGKMLEKFFHQWNWSPSTSHLISIIATFFIITFLHVVIGELAPKTLAIQKAETITLLVSKPLILFYKLLYPFIWALNGSARFITGLFGLKPASDNEQAHSEEELRLILSESFQNGEINQSEYKYVNNIFKFDERIAKEIMVPRPEIATISIDSTIKEVLEIVNFEKYTRYPVMDGDKDNIVGIINTKELMAAWIKKEITSGNISIDRFVKPVIRVIESIPIHELLVKLQKDRTHLAILIDEYGGTAGLATIEDILEEIVGEIRDEFDIDEISEIRKISDGQYLFDAKVLIREINDLLGINLNEDDVDTIGGWILTQKYNVKKDDIIEKEGYYFKVKEINEQHISYVEVTKK
ncbi:hemolysin family protein [Heyndrickxia vini]|uniref:HlyC/CorC family transporter n=1 Tax=Heyndrickxia vini TaxID=1476025 RepID=A0ABX7DZH5_9BACI|nr:hemolysin family protein [Heyndrickxia vini]QQZ08354.1 HlyC/CorC family transporter [Heyndrickxia vini]